VILQSWIDGEPVLDADHALALSNRGLHYGDGIFETMFLQSGAVRFLETHLSRVEEGCRRLGMASPVAHILDDLKQLPWMTQPLILKMLFVRGGAGRGYRAARGSDPLRLMMLYPWSQAPATLRVQWCASRWSSNPQLAGLKHLNRLEQVLAQSELSDAVDEGLMLDLEGKLISATSGNVFLLAQGKLRTPDLRLAGVRGVMRTETLAAARAIGIETEECTLWPQDLASADEVFVTNALRGIRSVVQLNERHWEPGPVANELQKRLIATDA
jgi:4-amino-4-deoxychorismate lyase